MIKEKKEKRKDCTLKLQSNNNGYDNIIRYVVGAIGNI
jgi:hypothetical protein